MMTMTFTVSLLPTTVTTDDHHVDHHPADNCPCSLRATTVDGGICHKLRPLLATMHVWAAHALPHPPQR